VNAADLYKAIKDRAAADTGTGGLFDTMGAKINGFYYAALPEASLMPFCMFTIGADRDTSAFAKNVSEIMFRISTFVARTHATITDPVQRGSEIIKRIYGDSSASQLTPTYGFHRHSLTLTDWAASQITYQSTFEEHGDDYYSWTLQFKLWLSK